MTLSEILVASVRFQQTVTVALWHVTVHELSILCHPINSHIRYYLQSAENCLFTKTVAIVQNDNNATPVTNPYSKMVQGFYQNK